METQNVEFSDDELMLVCHRWIDTKLSHAFEEEMPEFEISVLQLDKSKLASLFTIEKIVKYVNQSIHRRCISFVAGMKRYLQENELYEVDLDLTQD